MRESSFFMAYSFPPALPESPEAPPDQSVIGTKRNGLRRVQREKAVPCFFDQRFFLLNQTTTPPAKSRTGMAISTPRMIC